MLGQGAIKVTILLATYNGAKYVEEQLDSILQQTHTNWELIIRDDKSSDITPRIVASYQARYPGKILIVNDDLGNLGSTLNFNALLQIASKGNAKYVMLCDQDDFWLPDKVAYTLASMRTLEDCYGENFPLLIHTNFHYASTDLKIIKATKNFQASKITDLNLCHLLAQNPVYGCTTVLNRKLVEVIGDIPSVAENHDYWIAMVASAFGKIHYLDKKTILYRQHGKNISGNYNDNSLINRFKRIIIQRKPIKDAEKKVLMAEVFRSKYQSSLTVEQTLMIDDFIDFSKNKHISLVFKNLEHGVRRQTLMQTILFYISAYLAGNKSK
ncbi:glycosyltransferase family 2 protein [Hymenobacter sp. GOD-10R]|uniref:glycosyltransferase family 2 protein n=1 Tax=Hymenobacter sp. GOD-10R TaxID=3093922 RepID=UPI002D779CA8|nr:glycosyltransferase family 2 protein [Hymenobacter sp. GOD-10R]WRQ28049.1 glycosyltransferase family 2 protein [Hymenobacter sp. GOD-10R]